jgi:pimeloyl-ACP methyl ester carboxylesterase
LKPEHPSDPPRQHLRRPGGVVTYTDVGRGPALVALHGCPGSVRDWRWLGAALEPHLRLIRLDLPGFGETPLEVFPDPSFEGRARFVLDVLADLDVQRFAVMGHSAGGPLALELAAVSPDRVTGLVLLGAPGLRPHLPFRRHAVARKLSPLLRVPALGGALTHLLRAGFARAGFPQGLPDHTIQQSMHIINRLRFSRQRANAAEIRVPTLVAWTEDDRFIESDIGRELSEAIPHARGLSFSAGGHYLQKTCATEIGRAVQELL